MDYSTVIDCPHACLHSDDMNGISTLDHLCICLAMQ